jgi:hypothetical protein
VKEAIKPSERAAEHAKPRAEDSHESGETTEMRGLTVQEIERLLKSERPAE